MKQRATVCKPFDANANIDKVVFDFLNKSWIASSALTVMIVFNFLFHSHNPKNVELTAGL